LKRYIANCQSINLNSNSTGAITVAKTKLLNSSGYAWKGIELTRQELLCLLIFSEKATNRLTANLMFVSIRVVNNFSIKLRRKLNFSSKKPMVAAMQKAHFSRHFPDALIDSLFEEVAQKKLKIALK